MDTAPREANYKGNRKLWKKKEITNVKMREGNETDKKNQKVKCKTEETSWKIHAKNNTPVSFSLSLPLDIQFMNATEKQEKIAYY
jgi:hypothetical protein